MSQLTREQLLDELQRISRRAISLTLTSNASSYVSFCPTRNPLPLRLQRIFLSAPDEVLVALGRWLGGREKRCPPIIRKFINRRPSAGGASGNGDRTGRVQRLRPHGRCYDLAGIFQRVNQQQFDGRLTCRISWGRQSARRYVQVRTLGSYYRGQNLVMINPVLDQPQVPRWFVEFTVFHECLHATQRDGERPHNADFRQRLGAHPDYAKAMAWEKANIRLLTRRADPKTQTAAAAAKEQQPTAAERKAAHRVRRPKRGRSCDGQMPFTW
jgi:hypothetical protein